MLNKVLVIFFLLCTPVFAGDYACWDGTDRIVQKYKSVDGTAQEASGVCLSVTRAEFEVINSFYRHDSGIIREMTQAEKDVILQAEADAQAQAIEDMLDKFEISQLELMTAVIKRINIRIPSNPITKQEIIDQIKADR